MEFTTILDLESYIEDSMSSNGSTESAVKMVEILLEREYFILEWDGYYSTKKWDNIEETDDFMNIWDEVEGF